MNSQSVENRTPDVETDLRGDVLGVSPELRRFGMKAKGQRVTRMKREREGQRNEDEQRARSSLPEL